MPILIRKALILDPRSTHHGKKRDVFIKQGEIKDIGKDLSYKGEAIEKKGLCVSPGWIDLGVSIKDPGEEHKETLAETMEQAVSGGFTGILTLPNSNPVIQEKQQIFQLINAEKERPVQTFVTAALTRGTEGKELAELMDLKQAGARAFSDGNGIPETEILLHALQYVDDSGCPIISFPQDEELVDQAQVNEGKVSVSLGLKGFPEEAESLRIQRDLKILEMNGGRLHFSRVSTPAGITLIRQAKRKGLKVSCDVAAYSLGLEDSLTTSFEPVYKLFPPLRSKTQVKALWRGVLDGTVDAISSGHNPQDVESKNLEFDLADFGGRFLDSAFRAFNSFAPNEIEDSLIPSLFSIGPAAVLGVSKPRIEEGQEADLSLFTRLGEVKHRAYKNRTFDDPFEGVKLSGEVFGVVLGKKSFFKS